LNKKVRKGALRSALSLRASESKLLVIDDLNLESHKTKAADGVFKSLAQGNALIVDAPNQNLQLAVRNLPKVKYLGVEGINVFDVLKHEYLVMTEPTVRRLEGVLGK
jgi:large subunit ribosomal protein L4